MKSFNLLKPILLLLVALTLPQCTVAQSPDEGDDAALALPARFCDVPPAVEASRRYQLPVDTRRALAGNYGELRPNHFHGGLDFKTDQTIGHPVYCFADGFVRRAAINAYGYGLVLYVEHPALGLTSVYGHLDTFSDAIWAKLRPRQVEGELNNADVTFQPDELPVLQGQVIALSGNTGSSGGPHVHFELRNIPSQLMAATGCEADGDDDIYYDPQMYFLRELSDTQAPRLSHIYLYPQAGAGTANGATTRQVSAVQGLCATQGGHGGRLAKPLTAWGRVGLGLKAYDYMDGQANRYGVKEIRLYLEAPLSSPQGETTPSDQTPSETSSPRYLLLWHFRQDAFRYSEQRYTNSLTDYAAWVGEKSMIMKSFIEPGNLLQQLDHTLGDGLVTIDEERPYHFVYELEDAHGNLTSLDFEVVGKAPTAPLSYHQRGKEAPLSSPQGGRTDPSGSGVSGSVRAGSAGLSPSEGSPLWVECLRPYVLDTLGLRLVAPAGTFYVSQELPLRVADGIYAIGTRELPWHRYAQLDIARPDALVGDTLAYLVNLDDGTIVVAGDADATGGRIRTSGRYVWQRDTLPPVVGVVREGWRRMQIRVEDRESGLQRFRVLIDGRFVPFDMNNAGRYFGSPASYGIAPNTSHTIQIEAWDRCGHHSTTTVTKRF